jgi:hypothetical protein
MVLYRQEVKSLGAVNQIAVHFVNNISNLLQRQISYNFRESKIMIYLTMRGYKLEISRLM